MQYGSQMYFEHISNNSYTRVTDAFLKRRGITGILCHRCILNLLEIIENTSTHGSQMLSENTGTEQKLYVTDAFWLT